jgi:hypothetical protein
MDCTVYATCCGVHYATWATVLRGMCSFSSGCCDDTFTMEGLANMTHRDFINSFLNYDSQLMVEEKLCAAFKILPNGPEMKRLRWSGLFDREAIGLREGTPAQVLEHILNKKWRTACRR